MKISITQPFPPYSTDVWEIKYKEPDGWEKAWQVTKNGEHQAFFRYKDSAEYWLNEKIERLLLR